MTDPVVLIPGLQADGSSWAPILPRLMQRHPVCIPYGHQYRTSIAGMADSVLAQVPARFHLVGWSMGGYIALEILRRRPAGLGGLALVGTTDAPETPDAHGRRQAALDAVRNANLRRYQSENLRACIHDPASVAHDVSERLIEAAEALGAAALVAQVEAVATRPDSRGVLAASCCPLLIVTGREDRIIPAAESRRMHRETPGSTLHEIGECGHCPPLERGESFASVLIDWLDEAEKQATRKRVTAIRAAGAERPGREDRGR